MNYSTKLFYILKTVIPDLDSFPLNLEEKRIASAANSSLVCEVCHLKLDYPREFTLALTQGISGNDQRQSDTVYSAIKIECDTQRAAPVYWENRSQFLHSEVGEPLSEMEEMLDTLVVMWLTSLRDEGLLLLPKVSGVNPPSGPSAPGAALKTEPIKRKDSTKPKAKKPSNHK